MVSRNSSEKVITWLTLPNELIAFESLEPIMDIKYVPKSVHWEYNRWYQLVCVVLYDLEGY